MSVAPRSRATTNANHKTNVWSTEPAQAVAIVWAPNNAVPSLQSQATTAFVLLNASATADLKRRAPIILNAVTDWFAAPDSAGTLAAIAAGAAASTPSTPIVAMAPCVVMCDLAINSVSIDAFSQTGIR